MGNEGFLPNGFPLRHCACIFDHITISPTLGKVLYRYHHFWLLRKLGLRKTKPLSHVSKVELATEQETVKHCLTELVPVFLFFIFIFVDLH